MVTSGLGRLVVEQQGRQLTSQARGHFASHGRPRVAAAVWIRTRSCFTTDPPMVLWFHRVRIPIVCLARSDVSQEGVSAKENHHMPEPTPETPETEDKMVPLSNLKELEAERDRWKAEAERLQPFEAESAVRQTGFDPDSDKGKVLAKELARGDVKAEEGQPLHEALARYAENEYQWKPPARLTDTEQGQMSAEERLAALQSGTSSEQPAGGLAELEREIAEAREAGDFHTASRLQEKWEQRRKKQPVG